MSEDLFGDVKVGGRSVHPVQGVEATRQILRN